MITISKNEQGKAIEDCERLGSFFTQDRVGQFLREHPEQMRDDAMAWWLDGLGKLHIATLYEAVNWLLLLVFLAIGTATNAHATSGFDVVNISTPTALLTGHHCPATRFKIDAANFGESFAMLGCASWDIRAPMPEWGQGVHMLSIKVDGRGIYYDCRYLDSDQFAQFGSIAEFECFGSFWPSDLFSGGFDN